MSAPDTPVAVPPAPYAEWEDTLTAIVQKAGTALILGGTDVGKTTFTRLLLNRAVEAGHAAALIDADLGQSEIGPPGCVGLAFADTPVRALSDLPVHALGFVGSVSPAGHLPEHIAAVRRLADMAGGRRLIVDTSGYLHGAGARRLNQIEFELLSPAHVVALQRSDELNAILAPMRKHSDCQVHTPAVAAVIGKKSPALRTQRRAMRFASYFQEAKPAVFHFDETAFTGTWMGGGTALPAHLLKFLNVTLGPQTRVYYAETLGSHVGLMTSHPVAPHSPELGMVLHQLKVKEASVTVAPRLKHLLVGLDGANGKLLGLGLIISLDFRRRSLGVLTPVRTPAAARILHFGAQRILPNGTDGGTLRPGEI